MRSLMNTDSQHRPHGIRPCLALLMLLLPYCAASLAQDGGDSPEDRFHFYVGYQFISVDGYQATAGKVDIGDIDTHTIDVEIEYDLGERWTLIGSLPWVRKRYRGPFPHEPLTIIPPRTDSEFIDDGSYHSSFMDFHLGAKYLAKSAPAYTISPFVFFGTPSNDYTFFGNAAVGQQLDRLEVGTEVAFRPHFNNFYFQWAISHVFVEETLGVSVDHWKFDTTVGYFVNPNLSVRLFVMVKEGDGLAFPDDFPLPRNDESWFQHDRTIRHNYANAGLGVDWQFNGQNVVSLSVMKMIHADQVHTIDHAMTMGFSRSF